jgi:hypothetical protein
MMSKNDILTLILTFFCQKFCRGATILTSLLPTGFTVTTDHPSAGEVCLGRGPQWGAAPGTFLSISRPGPCRVRGEAGPQWAMRYLSKVILPHHSGRIPEPAALYDTSATYQER